MKTCGSGGILLLGDVDGDDPLGHGDLDRGQADAGGVVHGLEHVVDQPPGLGINRFHRFGDQPEPLVGENNDVAQCHSRDLGASARSVNARVSPDCGGACRRQRS